MPSLPRNWRENYQHVVGSPEYNYNQTIRQLINAADDPENLQEYLGQIPQASQGQLDMFPEIGGQISDLINTSDWDPFKSEFSRLMGRDIAQDDMNSMEYLSSLSNELVGKLPFDVLQGMPTTRTAQLRNEVLAPLLQFNPNLIAQMPIDRLRTFDMNVLNNTILPFLDRFMPNDASNLRNAIGNRRSQDGPRPSDAPPMRPWNPQARPGSARELIGGDLNLGDMTQDERGYFFPFQDDPEMAGRNLLRGLGFDVDISNPFTQFLAERMPSRWQSANVRRMLAGGDLPDFDMQGPDMTLGELRSQNRLTRQEVLEGLQRIKGKKEQGGFESLSPSERQFFGMFMAPGSEENQMSLFSNVSNLRGDMARAQARANRALFERFRNVSPGRPGSTFMDFLFGGGM